VFLVSDDLGVREDKIRGFLEREEPAVAVLLSAADCERTIRRAILSLGSSPTLELAYRLGRPRPKAWVPPSPKPPKYGSSLSGYSKAWAAEVKPRLGVDLEEGVVTDWQGLKKAFQLRHDLIHGDTGTTGLGYARRRVEVILGAIRVVHEFAKASGYDLIQPLKRRIKPRTWK
jgi:hypothetical protein